MHIERLRGKAAHRMCAGFFLAEMLETRRLLSASAPDIFIASDKTIGQFTSFGTTVNAAIASTGTIESFAVTGDDVFYASSGGVAAYDFATGATSSSLISGLSGAVAVAVYGSDLFVATSSGTIGEYTTSGRTIDSSLITGLASDGTTQPLDLAVSGSGIFVLTSESDPNLSKVALGTIAQYTMSGVSVNPSVVSNIAIKGGSITALGPAIFIANGSVVSEYTSAGAEVSSDLTPGAYFPTAVAIYNSDLYITTNTGVSEYTLSGQPLAPNLISGLTQPTFLAVGAAAGPDAELVFDQQPTVDQFAGEAISSSITVDVEDANGNLVTSDTSTVSLYIASGPTGADLSGLASASAQVVNGVAVFTDVIPSLAGSYTFKAIDGSLTAYSGAVQVISGSVDVANWGQISGWAYDPSTPSSPINVEVVISGGPTEPQVFSADQTRTDLESVLGSTDHGFDYSPPFLSVGSHTFSVWAIQDNGDGVLIGTGTIVSQNSLFDEAYYLREYPNVAAAVSDGQFATGYDQYLQYGQYEGFSPSPYWDESWYLQENTDVAAAVRAGTVSSGFMQYYQYGQYEGRGGLLYFNPAYYLETYPDVAAAVRAGTITPFEHYVLYGQYEGRSPMLYFSAVVCNADNAEILPSVSGESLTSDFDWFVEYGQYEGAVASNYFNEHIYLENNPDVVAAVEAGEYPDGFQHWLEHGQYEGRTAV